MTEHPFGVVIRSDLSSNANPINQGLRNLALSLLCHQSNLHKHFVSLFHFPLFTLTELIPFTHPYFGEHHVLSKCYS